jgi:hypothetical protein
MQCLGVHRTCTDVMQLLRVYLCPQCPIFLHAVSITNFFDIQRLFKRLHHTKFSCCAANLRSVRNRRESRKQAYAFFMSRTFPCNA